jgi:hypothetical protein
MGVSDRVWRKTLEKERFENKYVRRCPEEQTLSFFDLSLTAPSKKVQVSGLPPAGIRSPYLRNIV